MFENYTPTQMICVDLETNGLDRERHEAVEVAWENVQTRESGLFIPRHRVAEVLAAAAPYPIGLQKNRYIERSLWDPMRWDDGTELVRLWEQFVGEDPFDPRDLEERDPLPKRIFVAVNPGFDAHFLSKLFLCDGDICGHEPEPWDYHLRDLGSYAAGVLSLPLDHPPLKFLGICELLGVTPGDHTAAGDVHALAECVRALADIAEACTEDEFETVAEVA
jgi:DNA polymerase III epsilon subunit-like protein